MRILEPPQTAPIPERAPDNASGDIEQPLLPQTIRDFSSSDSDASKNTPTWLEYRFTTRGKYIGVWKSIKAIIFSSWLNVLVVFIPLSWVAHFLNHENAEHPKHFYPFSVTFSLSLLALIPLEGLIEYGGEQMSLYCGKDLGDLIVVTLSNAVEAVLAIVLFTKCELRLLQSTLVGVTLLHLLFVPGITFIVGGAKLVYQELNPHIAQLNHTLLITGVLAMVLPFALYTTLQEEVTSSSDVNLLQGKVLMISRGLAVILHYLYILSRIFLHNPPGDNNSFRALPDAPAAIVEHEQDLLKREPELNPWVCIVLLVVIIGFIAPTTQFLADSVDIVRAEGRIPEEWFGLVLLPLATYSADGLLAMGHFLRSIVRHFRGQKIQPLILAKARSIDMAIQFNLFWVPSLVVTGWCNSKPMSLLFDRFEVIVLVGACFLVNYVTADAKTNWAEGATMVAFYIMIALTAWFYASDPEISQLLVGGSCQV
ncbi:hypothetical protein J3R30DRAFT_3296562 [Lentinula aciculospora]|uniref:Sodium/calcium exchanger membrane region domain-containing protein n=1 Tax=Lentinula aciculospora TaxID=153920 RepID=A0A9W9A3E9_9AGAR|nr:hypothetical protein J3R30DRAFT_3296562 [Lentinula aciculospora]